MGTDSGSRPATPRSPALTASHSLYRDASLVLAARYVSIDLVTKAGHEVAERRSVAASQDEQPLDELPDDEGEMQGIEEEFRRQIAGLRRLPREARAHALCAAQAARQMALRLLRDRRDRARRSRQTRRRQTAEPR
jgi:hypothetical protein